ncbi:MAG: hypothetical protein QF610_04245 [Candidatus Thalassarchaeaceae archaeon]|nr:hypothetical protein [Candidatus Thalassarchaeaceae archaeon]|tara:strand:+ start:1322 stop:1540 length:219 start_codon:yes stop_codon:yes gene_type:complete
MSILLSYGSGIVTLFLSWFLLKDILYASITAFFFSSLFLYLEGPNAVAFSLCLSNGWIILNAIIEQLFPVNN